MTRRDALLAALVATIWGVNFVVIDWGMKGVPPLVFAAVRFTLVALPAVFLLPRPKVPLWQVVAVGLGTWAGQYCFLYASIGAGMPPGLASLVLQAQVALTIVFAVIALREPPTRAQLVGVALGVLGLIVVAVGRGGHVPVGALLLCLCAAVSWAIGNVVSRAAKVPGGLGLAAWGALVAALPAYLVAVLVDGPHVYSVAWHAFGWQALVSTAYTVVLSSLTGFGIYNGLLSRYPSSTVVPWVLLVPPIGIAAAWLLLGERPTLAEVLGGAVLVAGVLVAQRPQRPRRAGQGTGPVELREVGEDSEVNAVRR